MGGTPKRMENFAHFIMSEIGYKLPTGTQLSDISAFSYRYSMYKVRSFVCLFAYLLYFKILWLHLSHVPLYHVLCILERHQIISNQQHNIVVVVEEEEEKNFVPKSTKSLPSPSVSLINHNFCNQNIGWTSVGGESWYGYTVTGNLIT